MRRVVEGKPMCLHCHRRRQGKVRGLCCRCEECPEIRQQYPGIRERSHEGKPLCKHCEKSAQGRCTRGLCYACWKKRDIRTRYPKGEKTGRYGICSHCNKNRSLIASGICQMCSRNPEVRLRYAAPEMDLEDYGIGGHLWQGKPPSDVCPCGPGTQGKVDAMAARAERGEDLFSSDDCIGEPDEPENWREYIPRVYRSVAV